jgi:Fic family protein
MVYIYKKKVGNKEYYYLRISKSTGKKKITKDLAYLGSDPEKLRKRLDSLNKYKDEIRRAYRKINIFLESEYYLKKIKSLKLKQDSFLKENLLHLEACKFHFQHKFKKLKSLTQKETIENLSIEFSQNTTSLEGNTITLNEARKLFLEGKTPKNRTLREIYDLQNTKKSLIKLFNSKEELNEKFIINLHKNLLKNIDSRSDYRTEEVRIIKANFKSSPAKYVKADMSLLLNWYKKNKNKLHPFVLAIVFHHKFEKIHPFMDGNGRTGRMLVNKILISKGYPPMIFYKKDRTEYLDSLASADKINLTEVSKEYSKLIEFASNQAINSYWNLFL